MATMRFESQPVRSLQTMLRTIAQIDGNISPVNSDGLYGRDTSAAVADFQREHALPVTGITDQETWEEIVQCYENALIEKDPAEPIHVKMEPGESFQKGDHSPCLNLAQCMLKEIAEHYHCICCPEINGILDDATEEALSSFQQICSLPATGKLDKQTWKCLALHYPAAISKAE